MQYVSVQVSEVINGKVTPIEHLANKDERKEVIMENISPDKLAKVKYSIGMTLNLGNFQSAKVDVGIELPCHVDNIEAKYNDAVAFGNEKLMEEVDNLSQLKKVFGDKK